jgi:hypothetical protein
MRQARRLRLGRLCLGAGLISGAWIARALPPTLQTAALTDMPAPGAGGALFEPYLFGESLAPRINNRGQISFLSEITGPGVTPDNNYGIWLGTPGNLTLPIRAGDTTVDGTTLVYLGQTDLNDSGQFTMFGAGKTPSAPQPTYEIFHATPGAVTVLARPGQPVPGTALNFGSSVGVNFNNAGKFLFRSSGPQNSDYTLFRGVPGNFSAVMQKGQIAPGGNGRAFVTVEPESILFNDAGQVLFHAVLDGTPSWSGLFLSTPTTPLTPIVMTLQPLPAPNTANLYFDAPDPKADLNSAGDVIFTAPIRFSSNGLWKYNPKTGLKTLLLKGDPVPFQSPRTFQTFQSPKINGKGQFVVEARTDSLVSGIFGGSAPTNLRLLAANSGPAPGEPTGVNFTDGAFKKDLNEIGTLVFISDLTTGARGIWAADVATGEVEKVLVTGEPFDVGGGDIRTLKAFNVFDEDFLNDANQFVFAANFTDGATGVFVATVPEPSGIAWLLLAGASLAARRPHPRGTGILPASGA